jgi:peptidoglycan/LPS O-acetylase OafA/YrhL
MKPIGLEKVALKYRPDLDGLRAASCLLVFIFHVLHSKSWHGLFPWIDFLQGWIGVYIFFVLSGFLITSLLIGEEGRRGRIHFGSFLIRREFRIAPAYYITLALYALLCITPLAHQYAAQFRAGFWYWVFYSGDIASTMPAVGTLLGHSWSLAVEQRFYLVWPIALFAFSRAWQIRLGVFVVAIAAVRFLPIGDVDAYMALILGSATAFLRADGRAAQFLSRISMGVTAGLTLSWVLVLHWRPDLTTPFSCLVALFIYHLSVKESRLKRLLGTAPLVWLGQRSYSFYLLHVICLNVALHMINSTRIPGAIGAIATGVLLTMAAAAVSYFLIEEPFRRMGKSITESMPKPQPIALQ